MQVACLQAQLMQVKTQLAHNIENNQCQGNININVGGQHMNQFCPSYNMNPISPQSSLESIDHSSINDGSSREDFSFHACSKKRSYYNNNDLGELQEIALRMMRN